MDLKPNAEEVDDVKYVSLSELKEMMSPPSGLLWSPWFRIIVQRFLPQWWADLRRTLTTDDFLDVSTIHRFPPPIEHLGCYGPSRVGQAPILKQAGEA